MADALSADARLYDFTISRHEILQHEIGSRIVEQIAPARCYAHMTKALLNLQTLNTTWGKCEPWYWVDVDSISFRLASAIVPSGQR